MEQLEATQQDYEENVLNKHFEICDFDGEDIKNYGFIREFEDECVKRGIPFYMVAEIKEGKNAWQFTSFGKLAAKTEDHNKYLYDRYGEFLRAVVIEVWRLNKFTKFKKLVNWFKANVEKI